MKKADRLALAEAYREQWWVRVLLACEHDKLGLILRAALMLPTQDPPWLGPSAIISEDGYVLSNYVDEHNRMQFAARVCTVQELVDNLCRMCESLALEETESKRLFEAVRQWIKLDARPNTEQPEDRVPEEYRRTVH